MAFTLPVNRFKAALMAREKPITGLWLSMGSTAGTEILSDAGFDFVVIDGEHGPLTIDAVQTQLRAAEQGGSAIAARVPVNETWIIKQYMDVGAQTLVVPMIDTPAQAEAAARAMRYPPEGNRGAAAGVRAARYGRVPDYLNVANAEACLIAQVETAEALENLEAIAAVPGVDALFIGPSDLSASMGFTGRSTSPEMEKVIEDAIRRIKACGKPACTLSFDPETAKRYLSWGADMVAVGSDSGLLARAAAGLRKQFA